MPGALSIFGLTLIPDFATLQSPRLAFYLLAVTVMVLCFAAMYRLVHSRIGKLCQSLQQNEELASSIGVNVAYLRVIAYADLVLLRRHRRRHLRRHLAVDLSVELHRHRFGQLHAELLPRRPRLCLRADARHARPLFRLGPPVPDRRIPAADLSTLMIVLMLFLPNGLLSLGSLPGRRAEPWPSCLKYRGLTKRFGGLVAVNNVSFSVREREILSVIGPNGAGKSTLFKLISSFLRPTSGEVRFRGERISGLAPHIAARKGVVRTFQETTIFKNMTVRDNVIIAHHSALEGEPARLLPRHRPGHGRRGRVRPVRPTRSSSFSACRRSQTRSPVTCRMAICAPSASRSASPPTRRSCCSTSLSPG